MTRSKWGAALAFAAVVLTAASGTIADAPGDFLIEGRVLRTRTPSVRVHAVDGRPVPQRRLRWLEESVQRIGARLELDPRRLGELRQSPIDYVLLDDASLLVELGALDVDGLALPRHRRILTTRLPHDHEIAHVLAHLAHPDALDGNSPLLQEGLATYLGGGREFGRLATLALGEHALRTRRVDLAALLTRSGWNASTIGGTERYGIGARFVQYLVEARGGMRSLQRLLRLLAGREGEVVLRPAAVFVTQIEGIYGTAWDELIADFTRWRTETPVGDVFPVSAPRRAPTLVVADASQQARLWRQDSGWIVSARAPGHSVDLELRWGRARPREDGGDHRYAIAIDAVGGKLVDLERGVTLALWFAGGPGRPEGKDEIGWHLGTELFERVAAPQDVQIWTGPRFEVE